ncbi:hypothetical protein CC2G_014042 [Coprinopsis cinerea AmutBmut pab1-1]|nr:hypothetical protein CC2G_014042 [Coprinopsis cinerea AmutBmut pab1-1]
MTQHVVSIELDELLCPTTSPHLSPWYTRKSWKTRISHTPGSTTEDLNGQPRASPRISKKRTQKATRSLPSETIPKSMFSSWRADCRPSHAFQISYARKSRLVHTCGSRWVVSIVLGTLPHVEYPVNKARGNMFGLFDWRL